MSAMRLFLLRQRHTRPQNVLCLRARDFLRHIGLRPVCVPRQPVGSGYRALDPAGCMILSEVETSLALIMGLESSGIPSLIAHSLRCRRLATSCAGLPLLRPGRDKSTVRSRRISQTADRLKLRQPPFRFLYSTSGSPRRSSTFDAESRPAYARRRSGLCLCRSAWQCAAPKP